MIGQNSKSKKKKKISISAFKQLLDLKFSRNKVEVQRMKTHQSHISSKPLFHTLLMVFCEADYLWC